MQGIEIEKDQEIQIDMNISSYIPDEYIENSSQKIEIYQNIALCRNEEDIENITDEIIDRYGPVPKEIENLINVARIRNLARESYILKINQKFDNIVFHFERDRFNVECIDKLMKIYRNRIKFSPATEPYITFKLKDKSRILDEIKEFLNHLK